MNNKGFTLIELLATLVILAIVMSIGAFSIVAIMNSAKDRNYKLLITNIKDASESYYQECRFSNNSGITCNDVGSKTYQITLGELVTYGYLKGNDKDDNKKFTIVNPNDNVNISSCVIKVAYTNNKVTITDVTQSGSCPNQEAYNG